MLVAGARRGVDEEVVEVAPFDVFEELLDQPVFLRAPPDHGVVPVRQHELYAHHAEVVGDPDGAPSGVADVDGFRLDAHHFGDARPADVRVHDPDHAVRIGGKSVCEHGCEG